MLHLTLVACLPIFAPTGKPQGLSGPVKQEPIPELPLAKAPQPRAEVPLLAEPVMLLANGSPISTGKFGGHSGPLIADWDRDGKPDLLVGNYKGYIQVFGNVGTKPEPNFEDRGLLQAKGKDFYVKNW